MSEEETKQANDEAAAGTDEGTAQVQDDAQAAAKDGGAEAAEEQKAAEAERKAVSEALAKHGYGRAARKREIAEEAEQADEKADRPELTRRQREAAKALKMSDADIAALGDRAVAILENAANGRSDESRRRQGLPPRYKTGRGGEDDDGGEGANAGGTTADKAAKSKAVDDDGGEGSETGGDGEGEITADDVLYQSEKIATVLNRIRRENATLRATVADLSRTADGLVSNQDESAIDAWFAEYGGEKDLDCYGDCPASSLAEDSEQLAARNELVELADEFREVHRRRTGRPMAWGDAMTRAVRELKGDEWAALERRRKSGPARRMNAGQLPGPTGRERSAGQDSGDPDAEAKRTIRKHLENMKRQCA